MLVSVIVPVPVDLDISVGVGVSVDVDTDVAVAFAAAVDFGQLIFGSIVPGFVGLVVVGIGGTAAAGTPGYPFRVGLLVTDFRSVFAACVAVDAGGAGSVARVAVVAADCPPDSDSDLVLAAVGSWPYGYNST